MNSEFKAKLIALASRRVATDNEDFEAYSWCGGNADDAVELGERCGATDLARELCNDLDLPFCIEAEDDE